MTDQRNTIRSWALAAVAITSIALIGFGSWLIYLLAVPDWCGRAIGASKTADARPEYAVGGCFQLLNKQVDALSINSFIALGTLALCLAVLVVIVLAGGRLSFKAGREGVTADVSREAADGAKQAAGAATQVAEALDEAAAPAPSAASAAAPAGTIDDDFEKDTA